MRKLITLIVLLCGFMPVLWAADGCDQHLSREEFRNKQKAFIIGQAGLTKEEAAKFEASAAAVRKTNQVLHEIKAL